MFLQIIAQTLGAQGVLFAGGDERRIVGKCRQHRRLSAAADQEPAEILAAVLSQYYLNRSVLPHEILLPLTEMHAVRCHWVRGHAENEYNNRCDALAVREREKYA